MAGTITTARGVQVPAVTLRFASGASMDAARSLVEPVNPGTMKVLGLDGEGRIVVHYYPDSPDGGWTFGLTLCCQATDKGSEFMVVCRGCYGTDDIGSYDATVEDTLVDWD